MRPSIRPAPALWRIRTARGPLLRADCLSEREEVLVRIGQAHDIGGGVQPRAARERRTPKASDEGHGIQLPRIAGENGARRGDPGGGSVARSQLAIVAGLTPLP